MLGDYVVVRQSRQWCAGQLLVLDGHTLRPDPSRPARRRSGHRGAEGDRGVRQDFEHVLPGATMPAVLVEVGFIDHPIEGKELAELNVQAQLAAAIAEAIEDRLAD